jgi:hypothetical protein
MLTSISSIGMTHLARLGLITSDETGTDMGFVDEINCILNGHSWTLYKVDEIHWGTAREGGVEKNYYYQCRICLKDMNV